MTMKVSLLLSMDGGKIVKAEIDQVTAAVRKAADASQDMGRKAGTSAGGVDRLARAADGATTEVLGLDAAQKTAAVSTTQLARSQTLAAGATGNLVAQFNDIGMMLAAGQNPLQLAVQQGTQISQVIGPMGAAGAARALGAAFVGMLSPINLITIGAIAAGAAMLQWLTGAGEKTADLTDLIQASSDAIDSFAEASGRARASTNELIGEFGVVDPTLRMILEDLAGIARLEAWRSIDAVTESLRELASSGYNSSSLSNVQDFLELPSIGSEGRDTAAAFQTTLDTLTQAEVPAERLRAALDLREQLLANTGGIESMTEAQFSFYNMLVATIRDLRNLGVEIDKNAAAAPDWASRADAGANAARVALMRDVAAAEADAADAAARRRAEDDVAGRALLQTMAEQATLATLIARYGEDSAEVAAERAAQERRAFEAMLDSSTASEDLKNQLRLSFDVMQMMAGANFSGPIAAARGEAAALAAQLGISIGLAQQLAGLNAPVVLDPRDPNYDEGAALRANRFGFEYNTVSPFDPSRQEVVAVGGGTGGGGGGVDPAEEAARLMEQLQDRTDALLGRLDPLVAATQEYEEAQNTLNDAWEAGIITADEHAAAMAKVSEEYAASRAEASGAAQAWQFVGQTGSDVLMDIAAGAMSLEEAALKAAAALAQAVLQGALLGEGPFGDLFGGSSIVEMIVGSINGKPPAPALPEKAGGGMITGPGTGTSDDVLMWGSNGEFVVTAAATARYRPMLEAMNAGSPLPGFARGGMIGGGAGGGGATLGGNTLNATIDLRGARGNAEIEEAAYRGMNRALAEFKAYDLPVAVRAINSDPTRIG